ncbi:hypothetical protein [Sporolactobacillus pectinivorans]|uniref:hypothetical protein n=1 Tax=Sporolactobacillus pectinivorans TaxID=1591408 RepID=UPI000C256C4D|nr:hypothetical protein [Sporolactobacillus pectinivorans]
MNMIDPISLKLSNYLINKRKRLIANRKYAEGSEKHSDGYYLVSINDLKKILPHHSVSSVISDIKFLLKDGYIEQNYGELNDFTVLLTNPDKKVFEISSKGWSSIRIFYFHLISLIALSMIPICLIVLLVMLYFK